jgi:hypothetical protein
MQKALLGIGGLLCFVGVMLIVANLIMSFIGLSASINFGDAAKFEFVLVPFWQIGLAIALIGGTCLFASRRLKRTLG